VTGKHHIHPTKTTLFTQNGFLPEQVTVAIAGIRFLHLNALLSGHAAYD